jgi:uncharacterized phage protein (TIGR01671 family)
MREIKFRAWDTESKVMWDWDEMQEWWEDVGYHDNMLRGNHYVPMQYTEIKDKNGKEIYEGDILSIDVAGVITKKCKVIYENGMFEVYWRSWDSPREELHNFTQFCNTEIEVLGNIFENSELLGE